MRIISSIIYNKTVKVFANTIYHSSGNVSFKGDKATEEVCLDASSVCVGIVHEVPDRVLGNLTLNSWNNFINRQIAGVEYIINIIYKISVQSNTQGWKDFALRGERPGGQFERRDTFTQQDVLPD